jgi:drug/metabolite transporter (DMT)-like permease
MTRKIAGGVALAIAAQLVVGLLVAASSLLSGYPFAAGQAARYTLAAAAFGLITWRTQGFRPIARLGLRDWLLLLCLAGSGLVGFNLCILGSVSRIDPSLTGTIMGCTPVALAIVAPLAGRHLPRPLTIAAAVVVAAGAALVQAAIPNATPLGTVLAIGALACEMLFSLLAVPLLPRLGPLRLSFLLCLVAALALAMLAPAVDRGAPLRLPTPTEAAALAFLALVVTVVGFLTWYTALGRLGAERAGFFTGLIPVSALAGSALVGTSSVTGGKALGVLLVGAGVAGGLAAARRAAGQRQLDRAAELPPESAGQSWLHRSGPHDVALHHEPPHADHPQR